MVLCIIRDMTNTLSSSRFNVNLPASRSGRELIEEVGKLLAYEPDSFTLTYEKPEGDQFIEVCSVTSSSVCRTIEGLL